MKTVIILIASLILVSESFAFSKSEKTFLLGLGTGAVVSYALGKNDRVTQRSTHYRETIYIDSHHHRRHTTHRHDRHSYRHHHRSHHNHHSKRHHRHYEKIAFNREGRAYHR